MAPKGGKQETKGPAKAGESVPEVTIEVTFNAGPFGFKITCKGKGADACVDEAEKAYEKAKKKFDKAIRDF